MQARRYLTESPFIDFAYGMIGGVIGTIVLEKASSVLYQFESEEKKKIEESLRKEDPSMIVAADYPKSF